MHTGIDMPGNRVQGLVGNGDRLAFDGEGNGLLHQEQNIMGFDFERFPAGDAIESTPEHKQAVAMKKGRPISSRVIDRERDAILYCLSVGGGPENEHPGHYLLFYKGQITHINAFLKERWVDGTGRVATYRVSGLGLPPGLENERDRVVELIREALEVDGRSYPVPVSVVEVEIK